jgi:uncharacterized protein involved in oxidation of intracellular sulfur
MKTLLILNDAPYGTERSYNGLRLARHLLKTGSEQVKVFLMGDAVGCAKTGQKVPAGYYNAGDMLGMISRAGAEVGVCGTCIDARGMATQDLIEGAQRGSMDVLTSWHQWADKVVTF